MSQGLFREATPEFRLQSAPQRQNNSLTISRPLFVEDLTANSVANAPIKQRKCAVHSSRDLLSALEEASPCWPAGHSASQPHCDARRRNGDDHEQLPLRTPARRHLQSEPSLDRMSSCPAEFLRLRPRRDGQLLGDGILLATNGGKSMGGDAADKAAFKALLPTVSAPV